MPIGDMDAYFHLPRPTFIKGWISPLQGGWYLLRPDKQVFQDLMALVLHRYSNQWSDVKRWDVNGEQPKSAQKCLDDDQGLFWCFLGPWGSSWPSWGSLPVLTGMR